MMQKWQEELKKGNEKAFSIIFNEYYSLLCAVSYQYVQDVQISEAVAEDVFFTLWEKRHEALPVSSLKAYLLKAVRNHSIDYLRTQKMSNSWIWNQSLPVVLCVRKIFSNDMLWRN